MKFTKMHGIGNDYVYVNLHEETVPDPAALARAVSPRRFAIGADGLVLIGPSSQADVSMRMWNADGSEAEMCGNAIRCVAKYAYERGLVGSKTELAVDTAAGVRHIRLEIEDGRVGAVRVNMGPPALARSRIPMSGRETERVVRESLRVDGTDYTITCLSMGNPHCVIFTDEVDAVPLEEVGPRIETHEAFPQRINVHFAQVLSGTELKMRTWERGSGITLACGTGASAVCVAGVLEGLTARKVRIHLPGGELELEWEEGGDVFMTGPATEVYSGEWPETT
jgi:diaminopimelate epimerase